MPEQLIAIDGPAASGKSSVARALASRLGFAYVNSGAMYRAVTFFILDLHIDPHDAVAVKSALEAARIQCGLRAPTGDSYIRLDGFEPTDAQLRASEVNANVSLIASIPAVRSLLTARLRALAVGVPGVVMEGRDIGSVVFPHTPFKFYIDASPEVRSQRRALQAGGGADQILARDRTDSTRRASPLMVAEDAHVIDSSRLTIDGVTGEIIGRLKLKGMQIEDCPPPSARNT